MEIAQIFRACHEIRDFITEFSPDSPFEENGCLPHRAERFAKDLDKIDQIAHIKWMLDTVIRSDITQGKAQRWLGFVQGVLWSWGLSSIDELRNTNHGG